MKKILLITMLMGCAGKRMHGIDMDNLSGSPCVDGTIYNIKQAGCEVFYWGEAEPSGVKLRCSYADHDNFYTVASFYVVSPEQPEVHLTGNYIPWCIDSQAMMFAQLPQQ